MARSATFMPKPIYGDNGSGMHVHQSIWKGGKPLFAGSGYADLSDTLPLLHRRHHQACQGAQRLHQPADQQLQAPDPRLRSAGAAGLFVAQPLGLLPHSLLALAQRQARRGSLPRSGREPLSRLCRDADGGPGRHREQDPSGRPDGQGPLCPAAGRTGEGAAGLRLACAKRWTVSKADHAFLKKGGVFSEDFIDSYIELKMEEVYAFEHTPHPVEFKMYYSV